MAGKKVTLNQIAVLIEGVKSDVKAVVEGHEVIRREMREMKDELINEIDTVKGAVKLLANDLGGVKKDLGEVKKDLGEVKEKVNGIERTLDAHVRLPAHV